MGSSTPACAASETASSDSAPCLQPAAARAAGDGVSVRSAGNRRANSRLSGGSSSVMPSMAEKLSTNPADHACSGSSASTNSMAAASVVSGSGLREARCASCVSISMTAARTEAAEKPVSAQ